MRRLGMLGLLLSAGCASDSRASRPAPLCESPKACFEDGVQREGRGEFSAAFARLSWACERYYGPACGRLAFYFREGKGVLPDPQQERAFLSLGCDANDAYACATLGSYYEYGRGLTIDVERAKTLYQRACSQPDKKVCSYLAELYEKGKGVVADLAEARRIYELGALHGDSISAGNLAGYYLYGRAGLTRDPQKARTLADRACQRGGYRGCTISGLVAEKADDLPRAVQRYEKACRFGDQLGCTFLGTMYIYGRGTTKDAAEGQRLWQVACRNGVKQACKNLSDYRSTK